MTPPDAVTVSPASPIACHVLSLNIAPKKNKGGKIFFLFFGARKTRKKPLSRKTGTASHWQEVRDVLPRVWCELLLRGEPQRSKLVTHACPKCRGAGERVCMFTWTTTGTPGGASGETSITDIGCSMTLLTFWSARGCSKNPVNGCDFFFAHLRRFFPRTSS